MIGKGAFGEVYYGLLADVAHLRKELPVAIKVAVLSALLECSKIDFMLDMCNYTCMYITWMIGHKKKVPPKKLNNIELNCLLRFLDANQCILQTEMINVI